MNEERRLLLKSAFVASATGIAVGAGLLTSKMALASQETSTPEEKDANAVLTEIFGKVEIIKSTDIKIKMPDVANNGNEVPITVTSNIPNTEAISIVVANNIVPLVGTFNFSANTVSRITARIAMGKTSDVTAVIKAGEKLYSTSKDVKVTVGGCGI